MKTKTIILIRHGKSLGQTAKQRGISRKDSSLLDADLSQEGQLQAIDLEKYPLIQKYIHDIDLVIVSPLTRALRTATLGFNHLNDKVPFICYPGLKEKNSNPKKVIPENIARPIKKIVEENKKLLQRVNFDLIPENWPSEFYSHTLDHLNHWLLARPETTIVVVCHYNIIKTLVPHYDQIISNCTPILCSLDEKNGFQLFALDSKMSRKTKRTKTTEAIVKMNDDGTMVSTSNKQLTVHKTHRLKNRTTQEQRTSRLISLTYRENQTAASLFASQHQLNHTPPLVTRAPGRKLKCLMLHGYGQNAKEFKQQCATLINNSTASSLCEFVFVDAENNMSGMVSSLFGGNNESSKCWYSMTPSSAGAGWMNSFEHLKEVIEREKIDGVFGFSQGAAMVSLLVAEAATASTSTSTSNSSSNSSSTAPASATIKFACCCSGFVPHPPGMRDFLEKAAGNTTTVYVPIWHCFSDDDVVISAAKSIELARCFESVGNIVAPQHNGGHSVSNVSDQVVQSFCNFIQKQHQDHVSSLLYVSNPTEEAANDTNEANKANKKNIRVVSWNVLSNWWYVYKYYRPSTESKHRTATYREKLSEDYLRRLNGDIVCLQEINPQHVSVDPLSGKILPGKTGDDLGYARDHLGYDFVMEGEGNDFMRCCVLYRRDMFRPTSKHKDAKAFISSRKFIAVRLEPIASQSTCTSKAILVISVHLPAMDSPNANGVQILAQALKASKKIATENDAVIIAGDFNLLESDATGAPACYFLRNACIETSYKWRDRDNLFQYNYSSKKHTFGAMSDAIKQLGQQRSTFVVPDLFGQFKVDDDTFSAPFNAAVNQIFTQIIDGDEDKDGDGDEVGDRKEKLKESTMTPQDVEKWIYKIHGAPETRTMDGANQERLAKVKMLSNVTNDPTWWVSKRSVKYKHEIQLEYQQQLSSNQKKNMRLTRQDFHEIMKLEANTNPWSVQYDFEMYNVCWEQTSVSRPPFQKQLDKIYYRGLDLVATKSQSTLQNTESRKEKNWFDLDDFLPNAHHPSDHLAVTADFCIGPPVLEASDSMHNRSNHKNTNKNKNKNKNKKKQQLTQQQLSPAALECLEVAKTFGAREHYHGYVAQGADESSKGFAGKFGGQYLWNRFQELSTFPILNKQEQKRLKKEIQKRAKEILEQVARDHI